MEINTKIETQKASLLTHINQAVKPLTFSDVKALALLDDPMLSGYRLAARTHLLLQKLEEDGALNRMLLDGKRQWEAV